MEVSEDAVGGAGAGASDVASESSDSGVTVPPLFSDRYQPRAMIASGGFGDVFEALDLRTGRSVALKLECVRGVEYPQLKLEARAYARLVRLNPRTGHKYMPLGFPEVYEYGRQAPLAPGQGAFQFLAMEKLGSSVEALRRGMPPDADGRRHFDLITVLMIADQMMQRLEVLHEAGIISRDIKSDNIILGAPDGPRRHVVHLIDFGLSKRITDDEGEHIEDVRARGMAGTVPYASLRCHKFEAQSRRDDIESLMYVLIYLLRGVLPWSGSELKKAAGRKLKPAEVKAETLRMKRDLSMEELGAGCPQEFAALIFYAREHIGFDERPDYRALRAQFKRVAARECGVEKYDARDFCFLGAER